MSSSETSEGEERFIYAARYGRLEEVIELSSKFSIDVKVLSEALIWSCYMGHLDKVKLPVEHIATDVNYKSKEWLYNITSQTAACYHDHLDIVKYMVETCHADVNLPDSYGDTSLTKACSYFNKSAARFSNDPKIDLIVCAS